LPGRYEEVNGSTFYADSTYTITDSGSGFQEAYVYVIDGGSTATATIRNTAPIYSPTKKGLYDGTDKAIYKCLRDDRGSITYYTQVQRIGYTANRSMADFSPEKLLSDEINPGDEIRNNAYDYSGLTSETAIVNKMISDNFVQGEFYSANGFIKDNLACWNVNEIGYVGSELFFSGHDVGGSYSGNDRADYGFPVENTALVIYKRLTT